jgi:hypothetical protein
VLSALAGMFRTAKTPTMSTFTVRMINTVVFIATSPLRVSPTPIGLFVVQNEPAVNSVYLPRKLRASAPQKEIAPNIKMTTNTKASNRPTALVIVRSSLIARIWALAKGAHPRLRKPITSFDFMS